MDDWLTLQQIAEYSDGHLYGEDRIVSGITTDSRRIHPRQIFVALEGAHHDGHQFIDAAMEKIANGILVHRSVQTSLPQVLVGNTLDGLTLWSRRWREELQPKVVGITGSNGKTTVKQMVAHILSQSGKVCFTQGNLNNHIGVPLTLLSLRPTHDYAVIEMGANHHGEIRHLTHLVRPDIAVITNAGPAHLEGFGSLDGVAQAKGEIFEGLGSSGVAILNADDSYFAHWQKDIHVRNHKILSFGMQPGADVYARKNKRGQVMLHALDQEIELELKVPGTHYLYNALAAAAVTTAMGFALSLIKSGLETTPQSAGRLQLYKGVMGTAIFDDTYNANPASLRAAIEVLSQQKGPLWLILGDMGELGEQAAQLHYEIGQYAKHQGIERLYCLGPMAQQAALGFGAGAHGFLDRTELAKELLGSLEENVCVLVKGSRAMRMEEFVGLLKEPPQVH